VTRTRHWIVTATPAAVAPARHRALAQARAWGFTFDDVAAQMLELLVSEMVTNAVTYGQPEGIDDPHVPIGMEARPDGVLIIVRDRSHQGPSYTQDPFGEEHGWGVTIMQSLAQGCGWFPLADGKAVWAFVEADRATSREQRRIAGLLAHVRSLRPQIRVHATASP
jgi:anti-sigma regulatory factor (Ser/Thr protein kinase)